MSERSDTVIKSLHRTAEVKAPQWLADIVRLIAQRADLIEPLPNDRTELPEYIYRH